MTADVAVSCDTCNFVDERDPSDPRCRRHGNATAYEEFEIAHWPQVPKVRRCGQWQPRSATGATPCSHCAHWVHPEGGVRPDYLMGVEPEWWADSGLCTPFAPSPSGEDERRIYFRVTHSSSWCGDGDEVKAADT